MNRKRILATAKAAGYAEPKPSIESLLKWLEENAIDLQDDNGEVMKADQIKSAWEVKTAVQVAEDDAGNGATTTKSVEAVKARQGALNKATEVKVIGSWREISKRRYQAKAAAGKTQFDDADTAELVGAWMRSKIATAANRDYSRKSEDEMILKTMTENVATAGGYLVPDEYIARLLYNTEPYGAFQQICNVQPMSRDVQSVPRKTAIVAMSWVSENGDIPTADNTYDMVTMAARKMGRIIKVSSELGEDSAINLADDLASTFNEARGLAIDQSGILGDGSSTYAGHIGLEHSSANVTAVNLAGAWSAATTANHLSMMSAVKNVNWERCHWLCSREYYLEVMIRLDTATSQFRPLVMEPPAGFDAFFLNKPVKFCQSCRTSSSNATRAVFFGDFMGSITIGNRRDLSVETSTQAYWTSDAVGYKGTARVHINNHGHGKTGNHMISAGVCTA